MNENKKNVIGAKAQRKCWKCGKFIPANVNEQGEKRTTERVVFYQKCPFCGILL